MKMKDVTISREIKAHAFLGSAIELHLLGKRPNFDAFYCVLRSGRELKSLWLVVPPVPVNANGDRMSILDCEKEDELLYAVSHGSEPHQVLDVEVPRLRLMPMECRCRGCQCICDDVKFGESRNAVPSKGLFERRGQEVEENDIFVNVI